MLASSQDTSVLEKASSIEMLTDKQIKNSKL